MQFYPGGNFGKFNKFLLGTVESERVNVDHGGGRRTM